MTAVKLVPHAISTILLCLLACYVGSATAQAALPRFVVTTLDGKRTEGELIDWLPSRISVENKDGPSDIRQDSLLSVRSLEATEETSPIGPHVELIDGSLLPLDKFTVDNRVATIRSKLADQPLEISTDKIRFVQLLMGDSSIDTLWREVDEKQLPGDVLVIKKGEQLDFLSGMFGNVSEEVAEFDWDGDVIPVKRSKIAGLAYYHSKIPEFPQPNCWLETTNGARLPVTSVVWKSGERNLEVSTVAGLQFDIPLSELQQADYSVGKLTYLSDLTPLKQKWTPRIDLPDAAKLIREHGLPRRDQSFSGSSLSLLFPDRQSASQHETRFYAKGLALRSRSLLDYRIPAGMNRLTALAGIDPATANQGNVTLEFFADGNLVWQGEIDGGKEPVNLNIPLSNSRRLRIVVDYGTNLDFGDRLHLVDVKLTK